jgi:uncharacterized coiled-coil protein SlyX
MSSSKTQDYIEKYTTKQEAPNPTCLRSLNACVSRQQATIDRLTEQLAAANAKVEEMQRVAGQWRVAAEKLIGIENLAVLEAMANKLSTDEAALAGEGGA